MSAASLYPVRPEVAAQSLTDEATYKAMYQQSVINPDGFWREQAQRLDWIKPFTKVKQTSFDDHHVDIKWFADGTLNVSYNCLDRHLEERGDQVAIIWEGDDPSEHEEITYRQLHEQVCKFANALRGQDVHRGDVVTIYMPMIPEAVVAMLACARIGAIHSVVFGGFAAGSLATRIDDAKPVLMVSSDAGMRNGKPVPYKHLVDEACKLAEFPPAKVLIVDRGLDKGFARVAGRDADYAELRAKHMDAKVPVVWLESSEPSYILYTSGTTGKPKGVQRDTGGYAVALAASMDYIYGGKPGECYFSTSDIGWVVGHSYIVYGPLLNGMTTLVYEGLPIRPDAGIWWQLVEKYKVTVMFSAPTAIRVLKKQEPAWLHKYDLSSLRALFLAGEPLDEPTASWIAAELQVPVLDNYWQTETGWPILTICNGVEKAESKFGSPGKAVYGYNVKLVDDQTGEELTGANQKGVLTIEGPLPPGNLQTIWGDDERFVKTYWKTVPGKLVYSTFDWAVRDEDGYFFILGRTDDVINVAGHRLGTREIEESISSHPNIAEVAVVGVADQLKGQVAMAFAIAKDTSGLTDAAARKALEAEVMKVVDSQLGAVARPSRVLFVTALPKTRSGKLLRRAIQAVAEGRDPGDLTTMDDPAALQQIVDLIKA